MLQRGHAPWSQALRLAPASSSQSCSGRHGGPVQPPQASTPAAAPCGPHAYWSHPACFSHTGLVLLASGLCVFRHTGRTFIPTANMQHWSMSKTHCKHPMLEQHPAQQGQQACLVVCKSTVLTHCITRHPASKAVHIRAQLVCRGFQILQQSRRMWSNLMKAAWTWADGNAEDEGIRTCAGNLVKVLINIAGSLTTRGKAAESETILREALQVCSATRPISVSTQKARAQLSMQAAVCLPAGCHPLQLTTSSCLTWS